MSQKIVVLFHLKNLVAKRLLSQHFTRRMEYVHASRLALRPTAVQTLGAWCYDASMCPSSLLKEASMGKCPDVTFVCMVQTESSWCWWCGVSVARIRTCRYHDQYSVLQKKSLFCTHPSACAASSLSTCPRVFYVVCAQPDTLLMEALGWVLPSVQTDGTTRLTDAL